MLKFRVSKGEFFDKENTIPIISSTKEKMLGIYGDTKLLLTCECETVERLNEGMNIIGTNQVTINETSYTTLTNTYEFSENLIISGVNEEDFTITTMIDKYVDLPLSTIALTILSENVLEGDEVVTKEIPYVYFYFKDRHFYSDPTNIVDYEMDFYLYYGNGENDSYKIGISPDEDNDLKATCEYITSAIIRVKEEDLKNSCPEAYIAIFEGIDSKEASIYNGVTLRKDGISIKRYNFLYENKEEGFNFRYTLQYDRPIQTLSIPIGQVFATNTHQESNIKENFVDARKKEAINSIIDMEKDVYVPVMKCDSGFCNVYKIIFNLHFRQHRGDDWTVNENSYWNGTYMGARGEYESIELMNESSNPEYGYFSYMEQEDSLQNESYQSDLMTYLDFTNDDIRYQKNKVKKSFLRISFYDSTNSANQNLLAYSTIYFDTPKLFSRYCKYFSQKPYSNIDIDGTTNKTTLNLTGIRVNREPYGETITNNNGDLEDIRLSSQLLIEDSNNATSSSEGFYLYIWRDNESPTPQDIYMKCEFNHAGHGRTLPMMLPFFDWNDINPNEKGIDAEGNMKTFARIVEDWNVADKEGNKKEGDVTIGYGIQRYLKYSYVHFKYQYDINSKQHVYYLDDDVYGLTNLSTNPLENALVINLYEAMTSTSMAGDDDIGKICYNDGKIEVTITYDDIPSEGGTVYPTIHYVLNGYDCTTGELIITLTEENSDATITFSGCEYIDPKTGAITVGETTSTEREDICDVHVDVTLNGQTGSDDTSVYQEGTEEPECEYYDIEISLTYPTTPDENGVFKPTFSYSQYYECSDGTSGIITDGGELNWSFKPNTDLPNTPTFDDKTGDITSNNEVTEDTKIGEVTLCVTLNGVEGCVTVTVTQEGEGDYTYAYGEATQFVAYFVYNGARASETNRVPASGGSVKLQVDYQIELLKYKDGVLVETTYVTTGLQYRSSSHENCDDTDYSWIWYSPYDIMFDTTEGWDKTLTETQNEEITSGVALSGFNYSLTSSPIRTASGQTYIDVSRFNFNFVMPADASRGLAEKTFSASDIRVWQDFIYHGAVEEFRLILRNFRYELDGKQVGETVDLSSKDNFYEVNVSFGCDASAQFTYEDKTDDYYSSLRPMGSYGFEIRFEDYGELGAGFTNYEMDGYNTANPIQIIRDLGTKATVQSQYGTEILSNLGLEFRLDKGFDAKKYILDILEGSYVLEKDVTSSYSSIFVYNLFEQFGNKWTIIY